MRIPKLRVSCRFGLPAIIAKPFWGRDISNRPYPRRFVHFFHLTAPPKDPIKAAKLSKYVRQDKFGRIIWWVNTNNPAIPKCICSYRDPLGLTS